MGGGVRVREFGGLTPDLYAAGNVGEGVSSTLYRYESRDEEGERELTSFGGTEIKFTKS